MPAHMQWGRMTAKTRASGTVLDDPVKERFERVGRVLTLALGSWISGADIDTVREIGVEAQMIFGELATQQAAPLNEVVKRCLTWRHVTQETITDLAAELSLSRAARDRAHSMLQHSLSVTLVRMCEMFEAERVRYDEERSRHHEELAYLATHDELTKLPNRALIIDRLEQSLVRARHNEAAVAVLFIDLDNFKSVNDTLGHDAGDALLRAVAERLNGVVRDVDALGRLGGDEFVLVTCEDSLPAGANALAQRLLDALKQPFLLGEAHVPVSLTASIGIEVGEEISATDLLRDADVAMYRAKWAGGDRHFMFRPGPRPERRAPRRRWHAFGRRGSDRSR